METTNLYVAYKRVGDIPISQATVNVTIDATTLTLTWDSDLELYKITFIGSDLFPGFGAHNLAIQAWREGYEAQSNKIRNISASFPRSG